MNYVIWDIETDSAQLDWATMIEVGAILLDENFKVFSELSVLRIIIFPIFLGEPAINEEIVPNFDVTLIETNEEQQRKEANQPAITDRLCMCWIESSSLKKPLREIFPKSKSDKIINDYLKWEKRWKLRKNLNSKIPLLGRFRFGSNR